MESQLTKKEEDCEKLKQEILSLRKEVDQLILSCQRSPFDKSDLGYVGEP